MFLQSVKFDDLCTSFKHHEQLDASHALLTLTKTAEGAISGIEMTATANTSVIPVTFPTGSVSQVRRRSTLYQPHSCPGPPSPSLSEQTKCA